MDKKIEELALERFPFSHEQTYKEQIDNIKYRIGFIKGYQTAMEDKDNFTIDFADWINANDYEKIHGNRWCKKFMSYTHSTTELLHLYKNQSK